MSCAVLFSAAEADCGAEALSALPAAGGGFVAAPVELVEATGVSAAAGDAVLSPVGEAGVDPAAEEAVVVSAPDDELLAVALLCGAAPEVVEAAEGAVEELGVVCEAVGAEVETGVVVKG
jgi:hypothetical protein